MSTKKVPHDFCRCDYLEDLGSPGDGNTLLSSSHTAAPTK